MKGFFLKCQSIKIQPQKETYTQQEYISYAKMRLKSRGLDDLVFSIPNEGKRDEKNASRMIAEGLTKGIPDTFVSLARGAYHGLYIEFKRSQNEKLTEAQARIIPKLRDQGFYVAVCWDSGTACELLEKYLALKSGQSII